MLVDGADSSEGRVEICINNAWGTVCDNQFGTTDAKVICAQLGGFSQTGKATNSKYTRLLETAE